MTKLPFAATVASGWPPDAEVGSSPSCLGGWEDPHPDAEPRMWREDMVTSSCLCPPLSKASPHSLLHYKC